MYRQMLSALLVGVVVVGVLEMGVADAKPAPPQVAAMADALKYLQELDKYYSQVSRPRPVVRASAGPCQARGVTWTLPVRDFNSLRPHISRTRAAPGPASQIQALQKTLKFLQLQELGKLYSLRARPRFGKRSEYVAPADDTMMEASERILESLSRRR
ncbi:uncharacterized protein NPF isoform X1 [Cherax quadricarinatus]|uniref:uncharacterized protein NPF isoform X1 n=1 Tax=Cherax quadricarinatus TaxID=27406 RepID=UPI00387ECC82